jgi:hypothetical protein
MLPYLPAIVALGLAAVVAAYLARSRPAETDRVAERKAAATALAIAIIVQAFHFGEEFLTGFHDRLGPLLGLPEMPPIVFAAFNVAWLLIWFVAIPGVARGSSMAFFAAWFLAIAGLVNLIAHPLLAVAARGYFPGLVTSVPIGIAAGVLWKKLVAASSNREGPLA